MQVIPVVQSEYLRGKSVVVGAWIWASSSIQTRTPTLEDGKNTFFETINVDTIPAFFSFSAQVDDQAKQLLVKINAARQPESIAVRIYYDGIILVEAEQLFIEQPSFQEVDGEKVVSGSEVLKNYIRNASFERAALKIRPKIDALLASYLPARLSLVISSLIDIEVYRAYYLSTFQHLFRSFWAVFGWGQVYLAGSRPYRILLFVSSIAFFGDAIYLWRNRRRLPWDILGFLGIALVGVWGMVATRGVGSISSNIFIPAARYAYPVVVPTVMLLVVGWREILKIIGERFKISQVYQIATIITFLLILNVISILSIRIFYNSL
jgi:hypothetical protein